MQGSTVAGPSRPSSAASSARSSKHAIDPVLFARIQPAEYLSRFLAEGFRPDGRRSNASRQPAINVGSISSAHGSALVRMGDTSVLCGVMAEIAEPNLLAPGQGYIVPNVDLPAMCSSKYRPGPPSDEAQAISYRLRSIISGMVPLRSLCIHREKAVWTLYVDVICLNDDGSLIDAVTLAAAAALRNTRLPKVTWDEDAEATIVSEVDSDATVSVRLQSSILCASFGLTSSGQLLPDLTSFEEPLCQTQITVGLDEANQLKYIWQAGIGGLQLSDKPAAVIQQCITLAKSRCEELRRCLSKCENN